MIPILSACFAGPRASQMPYDEKNVYHGILETMMKVEIMRLVRVGVSEFYTGGQTGIDTLAALLVLQIKEELGTTANLHLVLPYKNMHAGFSALQKDAFEWIEKSADTVAYLHEGYAPGCYRERNRHMVEWSDYLVAVTDGAKPCNDMHTTIDMARKKEIRIITIDPVTFEIMRE